MRKPTPKDPRANAQSPDSRTPAGGGTAKAASDAGIARNKSGSRGSEDRSEWTAFRTVVILVGVLVVAFGAYYLATGTAGLPDSPDRAVDATLENQYRFFAAMMIGVGAAFVTIAVKFQWSNMLWLVCLIIFAGGIGRVLSWALSGTPHFTMIILMIIELAFPAALLVWHAYIVKTSDIKRKYSRES